MPGWWSGAELTRARCRPGRKRAAVKGESMIVKEEGDQLERRDDEDLESGGVGWMVDHPSRSFQHWVQNVGPAQQGWLSG